MLALTIYDTSYFIGDYLHSMVGGEFHQKRNVILEFCSVKMLWLLFECLLFSAIYQSN